VAEQRAFDPLVDKLPARFVVGIDLGTTNSAVSYVDTHEEPWAVRDFRIPQIVAPGQVEARDALPSFHYQGAAGESSSGAWRLPWSLRDPHTVVGFWAADEGAKRAGRLIASAKSWLCHSGVDRTADLLPWHAADDVERLSPVEVSSRYLAHMRDAWDARFPDSPLAEQDIILTLPASFDEVARELTIEAASKAALPRVVLIEEPQAAFYAWVYRHREDWHQRVEAGQAILVCDIGGGTTDFTLLRVRRDTASEQKVQFHRVAVGEHLILGGDNLDLALARHVEQKLGKNRQLDPRQWDVLVRSCRGVKEVMLSDNAPEALTIHVAGTGSKLIGAGIGVEVAHDEVRQLLVEGFLPRVGFDEVPQRGQSGFREFGLPYAADPAMTRYLAQFLKTHRRAGLDSTSGESNVSGRPDVVLFNGGFFASPILRARLLEVLTSWFQSDGRWSPLVLDNDRLDLAVARGAAYFGMVRRGQGVRIVANAARSYYVGVESDLPSAVCLLPANASPGEDIEVAGRSFLLTVASPVEFPIYVSSTRLTDPPGALVEIQPEQMRSLPPIRTVIRAQRRAESGTVPVQLHARLTEIGTMELWCNEVGRDRSWRLQFDVRSATQTDVATHQSKAEAAGFVDEATWATCETLLADVFSPAGTAKPDGLMKRFSQGLGSSSNEWPPSLLRRIWEWLMAFEAGRRKSAAHEVRWLNLVGFALRPGYGLAADDWRVTETWRTVRGKLSFAAAASRIESLILWRRIGGGLSSGQQRAIVEPLLAPLRDHFGKLRSSRGKERVAGAAGAYEMWCLFASLELLQVPLKIEFGDMIAELLGKARLEPNRNALVWALGRLGQRVPVYGPLNTIVPAEQTMNWLNVLLQRETGDPVECLAVMQMARRTDDRYRDLNDKDRERAAAWLVRQSAPEHTIELVRVGGQLDDAEQSQVYGESLPKGLRLTNVASEGIR
jgi:hypothetical protein